MRGKRERSEGGERSEEEGDMRWLKVEMGVWGLDRERERGLKGVEVWGAVEGEWCGSVGGGWREGGILGRWDVKGLLGFGVLDREEGLLRRL